MYIEAEIPLSNIRVHNVEAYINTWKMVDEDEYLDPKKTPLYEYYQQCKADGKGKYDSLRRVGNKIELYLKIKEEGLDPLLPTRMTCTFDKDNFHIRNGNHRFSMILHWGRPDPLNILIWVPDKEGKTDVYV